MPTLNLLVLRCRDLNASQAFYEALGLRFTPHAHGSGPAHLAHETPTFVLELYPAPAPDDADQTALGFDTEDLQSLHHHLTQSGHAPTPIKQNPWGQTFVIRDPDDRRVELRQL